jgi:hypothetical protein
VRQAKGTKNRDDSIASAISLRKEAAPNVGHHYKRGKKIDGLMGPATFI